MSALSTIFGALRYGWQVCYCLEVEGIGVLFTEADLGASNPTGFTQSATLRIGDSAAIGSQIDREKGLGVGYDLTVQILRDDTTADIFKKPTKLTELSATLAYNASPKTISVKDATGWSAPASVYIGNEKITISAVNSPPPTFSYSATTDRGGPDNRWPAYTFDVSSAVSTWVTDGPLFWRGRGCRLWAVPVDPFGSIPAGSADMLASAVEVFRGYLASSIAPFKLGWSFTCRSLERKLEEPLSSGLSASGTYDPTGSKVIELVPPLPAIAQTFSFLVHALYDDGGTTTETRRPGVSTKVEYYRTFAADTKTTLTDAEQRAEVVAAWEANKGTILDVTWWEDGTAAYTVSPEEFVVYGDMQWRKEINSVGGILSIRWRPWVQMARLPNAGGSYTSVTFQGYSAVVFDGLIPSPFLPNGDMTNDYTYDGTSIFAVLAYYDELPEAVTVASGDDSEFLWVPLPFELAITPTTVGMKVTSDTDDIDDIPTSGWIEMDEVSGGGLYRYTGKEVTGNEALLMFDEGSGPNITTVMTTENDAAPPGFTVEFIGATSGSFPDVMRRMIMSSGRGDNDGTYDTLAQAYGYDIAAVNTASFSNLMDGSWQSLLPELLIRNGASFKALVGDLLSLNDLAIVTRAQSDETLALQVVQSALMTAADPTATITDSDLALTARGREPVRHLRPKPSPNIVRVEFEKGSDNQTLIVRDIVAMRSEGTTSKDYKASGLSKNEGVHIISDWAAARFVDRHGVMAFEIDTHASGLPGAVDVGDVVKLELTHWNLWNMETGAQGYTGQARVIGRRLSLATGILTLTVLIQGTQVVASLAPALVPTAFAGPAAAPTSITVSTDAVGLCKAYLASANPFTMVVFKPGSDTAGLSCDVSAVSGAGVLTVDSWNGSLTFSTDYRLTVPQESVASDAQDSHTHKDDGTVFK